MLAGCLSQNEAGQAVLGMAGTTRNVGQVLALGLVARQAGSLQPVGLAWAYSQLALHHMLYMAAPLVDPQSHFALHQCRKV